MSSKTTLTTFTVKAGMEARAEEWMRVLIERQVDCVETLDRERMHIESIFKSTREGRMRLSWLTVQSVGGDKVRGSPHEVDTLHVAFWDACIEHDVPPATFEHVVSFVAAAVAEAIDARNRA